MLTAAEIASMRATAADALPGTAIIQTLGGTVDAYGEGSATWTAAGTVDCRIAPMGGSEREQADRISEDADWIVTLPAETAITTASKLVIAGTTYNVEAVRAPRSYEITRRVETTKVT